MKYLENLKLERLTNHITNRASGGLLLNGKIEVYSTKKAGDDKKSSKILEHKLSETSSATSPFTKYDPKATTKVLIDLIQTLNASFVDFDFSELSSDSFIAASLHEAVSTINAYLGDLSLSFINEVWFNVNESIGNLNNCDIYRLANKYFPGVEDGSAAWSFNFFFCNKELKRICYFTCTATSRFRKNKQVLEYSNLSESQDYMMSEDEVEPRNDENDDEENDGEESEDGYLDVDNSVWN